MESLKKHRNALILIAILITLKWIVVPVYEWQQVTLSNNALLAQRLAKSAEILEHKDEMQAILEQLSEQLSQAKGVLFAKQPENSFQLAQQRAIERLFAAQQMKITSIAWQVAVPLVEEGLTQYEVILRFDGQASKIQPLLTALNSQNKWYQFDDFQFRFEKRRDDDLGEFSGRMSIKLYMLES